MKNSSGRLICSQCRRILPSGGEWIPTDANHETGEVLAGECFPACKELGAPVEVPADDFGTAAGVIRRKCDNPACQKPVTLSWKTQMGPGLEFCSNPCLKKFEKGEFTVTENNETAASPISAGAPAAKKGGKKAAAKKTAAPAKKAAAKKTAPAKKSAKPKAASNGVRGGYDKGAKITVVAASTASGVTGKVHKLFKTGMTVQELRDAAYKKEDTAGLVKAAGLSYLLTQAVNRGFITVK